MSRLTSILVGIGAIAVGCVVSLLIASKSMPTASAQGGVPEMNLPPPSDALPPENPVPPAAQTEQPQPPAPNETPAAPVDGTAQMPPAPTEGAPGAPLDSSQDPGLKTLNPEGYVYDPTGRRDPFIPSKIIPTAPEPSGNQPETAHAESPDSHPALGKGDPFLSYYLRDYHLVGILWDVRDPRAIVQTPDKQTLTFRVKMKVGRENAVIAAIREKEILLIEPDDKGDYKKGEVRVIRMKN